MPVEVLTNAAVSINGVDLSSRSNQVTLTYEVEAVEATAFGDAGRKFVGGLQNNTIDIELHQDYAAAQTEATLFPLVGQTTTVVIVPKNTSPSATNPYYTVSGTYLAAHQPVQGTVGELATVSIQFQGGTLVKTTSAP